MRVLLLPPEWAGKRTITLRRPGGRGAAEAPTPDRVRRVPDRVLSRTAARILVDQLLVHGVDTAYCVPGESYLGVLDAIGDSPIRLYTTRHEAAAANMADAYGKLTGRPGVCLVTRAPGATHAVGRDSHRVPGLDPAGPARRPGATAAPRPRGVPGARLHPDVRRDGEVGDDSGRRSGGSPSSSRTRSTRRRPVARGRS